MGLEHLEERARTLSKTSSDAQLKELAQVVELLIQEIRRLETKVRATN
jgi:hypothetical protein